MMKQQLTILCIVLILATPAMSEGFIVESITSSQPINNYGDLNNTNFTINLVVNDGGQSISGYISDFSQIPNVKVKTPIKLEISRIQELLTYPIVNQGTVWKYSYVIHDAPNAFEGAKCDPKPAYCFEVDMGRLGIGKDRVVSVSRYPAGSYARFQNPDISWLGTITLTINGTQYKQQIGSGEKARGSVYFKNASVMWLGSLVTGRGVPNQNLCVGTNRIGANRWRISNLVNYEYYTKSLGEVDTTLSIWQQNEKDYYGEDWDNQACKDHYCTAVLNKIFLHNILTDTLFDSGLPLILAANVPLFVPIFLKKT